MFKIEEEILKLLTKIILSIKTLIIVMVKVEQVLILTENSILEA